MESNALVRDYLARLETATAVLPAARRAELVGEVREHIEAAIAVDGAPDEAAVRNALDRLGSPEEIVDAEIGDSSPPVASPAIGPDGTAIAELRGIGLLEIVALLLVTVGTFAVPIVGPAVGIALVWVSRVWSTRTKLLITAVSAAVVLVPIIGLSVAGSGGAISSPVPVR